MSNSETGMFKKATLLKLALRTNGVRVETKIAGIGKTIKENVNGLYRINAKENEKDDVPNELVLYKKITTKLVNNPLSFLSLREDNKSFYVYSDFVKDEPLIKVGFSKRPKHYSLETTKGMPMKFVGQVMGEDCLAIAVDKQCAYFKSKDQCKYCNITPTNNISRLPRFSSLEDIAEMIRITGKNYRFIDLTGGTFEDRDEECKKYTAIGDIIRDNLGKNKYSGPFSLSPPNNLSLLEKLRETNVDVISFNIDVWDDKALKEVCPGKYKIGKKAYEDALLRAKDLWGRGNSVIQFLAGPWETNESLLQGTEYFLNKGVLVNITTYQPSPNSYFSARYVGPKSLLDLVSLYLSYGELIKKYGLYPNQRLSILTSESGNRSSIANEVVKGYLTKDNFNKEEDLKFAGSYRNG